MSLIRRRPEAPPALRVLNVKLGQLATPTTRQVFPCIAQAPGSLLNARIARGSHGSGDRRRCCPTCLPVIAMWEAPVISVSASRSSRGRVGGLSGSSDGEQRCHSVCGIDCCRSQRLIIAEPAGLVAGSWYASRDSCWPRVDHSEKVDLGRWWLGQASRLRRTATLDSYRLRARYRVSTWSAVRPP